jgi:hypothetical protein
MTSPVTVFFSTRANDAKAHLDVSCTGLERIVVHPDTEAYLGHASMPSLWSFAQASAGAPLACASRLRTRSGATMRPCRYCALEYVVDAALRRPGRRCFVTFCSLPSWNADSRRFETNDITESSMARLVRIAGRAGLALSSGRLGPIASGFVPQAAVPVLAANLRTIVLPDGRDVPAPEQLPVVWSLVDETPEGDHATGEFDPWEVALAL